MASLPGGSFTMGDRKDDVTVQPFCLDLTEVTADAFAACVRAGACNADLPGAQKVSDCGKGGNNNALVRGRGAHPMNCVDAGQSSTYCASQGKRLPTEEEWEWAAHGASEGRVYPWGNAQPDSQLCWSGKWCKEGVPTGDPHTQCNWTELLARDSTCPVGSFAAGDAPGGIHDLAGNVSEWTSSNFDASGTKRVTRGGGWSAAIASAMRAADRYPIAPTTRGMWLGFRCAR
jgi:formylglycine-generating enzyme required for sulfatase activity